MAGIFRHHRPRRGGARAEIAQFRLAVELVIGVVEVTGDVKFFVFKPLQSQVGIAIPNLLYQAAAVLDLAVFTRINA